VFTRAALVASRSFGRPPMVLKDPRLCITLPFWRKVLEPEPCAVLILRDPLEAALSLSARHDDIPVSLGLAMWDRYVRQAVAALEGLPVFAIDYASAFNDPRVFIGEIVTFLNACGISVSSDRLVSAAGVLDDGLRYQRVDTGTDTTLATEERPLLEVLRRSLGPHERWSPPELPDEPSWVGDVIELTAAGLAVTASLHGALSELKWIKASRLFRATKTVWRLTGTGPVLSPAPNGPIGGPASTKSHHPSSVGPEAQGLPAD
jgi:hypothetical protein